MLREIVYGVAAVVLPAYTVEFVVSIGDKPRESPVVRPTIPLIGHGDASDKSGAWPHLDEQNIRMGNRVLLEVDNLLESGLSSGARSIQLLDWTRHLVIQASSCGVYGNEHPLVDPKVEKAFWNWQNYLTAYLAGLDISGKGYAQSQIDYDAYIQYCHEPLNDGSQLARGHKHVLVEAGVDEIDYAKQASLFTIAVFSNTALTLYWTIYELF